MNLDQFIKGVKKIRRFLIYKAAKLDHKMYLIIIKSKMIIPNKTLVFLNMSLFQSGLVSRKKLIHHIEILKDLNLFSKNSLLNLESLNF